MHRNVTFACKVCLLTTCLLQLCSELSCMTSINVILLFSNFQKCSRFHRNFLSLLSLFLFLYWHKLTFTMCQGHWGSRHIQPREINHTNHTRPCVFCLILNSIICTFIFLWSCYRYQIQFCRADKSSCISLMWIMDFQGSTSNKTLYKPESGW